MIVALNGKRIPLSDAEALIGELGLSQLHDCLTAEGYRLAPLRAPRGLRHGRVSFRVVWECRAGDVRETVRATHSADARIAR